MGFHPTSENSWSSTSLFRLPFTAKVKFVEAPDIIRAPFGTSHKLQCVAMGGGTHLLWPNHNLVISLPTQIQKLSDIPFQLKSTLWKRLISSEPLLVPHMSSSVSPWGIHLLWPNHNLVISLPIQIQKLSAFPFQLKSTLWKRLISSEPLLVPRTSSSVSPRGTHLL